MTVRRWTPTVAGDETFGLAEGPVWDADRERLLWVDIPAGIVHVGRLEGGRIVPLTSYDVDRTVGAVVVGRDGDLLVAGEHALVTVHADGRQVRRQPLLPAGSRRRLNDGACDAKGRFVLGSLTRGDESDHGNVLVRIELDGSVTTLDDDLTLSNGIGWSPDGGVLYSVDSIPGVVWARSYDGATGAVGDRSPWLRIDDGIPDGLCVDTEGHLWIAIWGAGQVRRYSPAGDLVGVVEVPAPHTTSVTFAGAHLDQLVISSATSDLTAQQLADAPDSGRLFLADVGVVGLPAHTWAGSFPTETSLEARTCS
ncbi:MAG: hypothetical protein QOF57_530 [Frankiaceae bacterium]|nr:hypothetical protein [Frankiaceae bacterium]